MYERRFEASLYRTMGELKKLQQARKQKPSEIVETEAVSYHGQDARVTRGRDARDTARATLKKQSQSAAGQNDLSSFKKREYELLIGATPPRNKANDSHLKTEDRGQKTEVGGQKTEKRRRREALVCRY
jgi:hypothetical protein